MFERVITWLFKPSTVFCKHQWIRKFDEARFRQHLECMKCFKQTPGIDLTPRAPHTLYRK